MLTVTHGRRSKTVVNIPGLNTVLLVILACRYPALPTIGGRSMLVTRRRFEPAVPEWRVPYLEA